jgi:hypothetical protein
METKKALELVIEKLQIPSTVQQKILELTQTWVEKTRLSEYFEKISEEELEKILVEINRIFNAEEVKKVLERLLIDPKLSENNKELRLSLIKISVVLSFLYYFFNKKNNLPTVILLTAPQGLGKTFIALLFFYISKKFGILDNTCIFVHLKNLKKQWKTRLKEFPELENLFEFLTLQKVRTVSLEFLSKFKAFVWDESQCITKHSAVEEFLITRYLKGKINVFSRELLFFIFPSSEEEGRILKVEKIVKKVNASTNPLLIKINKPLFEHKFYLVEINNTLRESIYKILKERRETRKKVIFGLNKNYKLKLNLRKFDKLCQEDLEKIKFILYSQGLNEEEIEEICSAISQNLKAYKLYGYQTQLTINYHYRHNLLNSQSIQIQGKPLSEISEANKPLEALAEIIQACGSNKKILIYSWNVYDLKKVKEYLEKKFGEKIEILKEGKPRSRIAIISEKNASGIDFSDFSILILFRYPKKISKLTNIVGRIRGGEIYFIYWAFEKAIMEEIIQKLESNLGGEK